MALEEALDFASFDEYDDRNYDDLEDDYFEEETDDIVLNDEDEEDEEEDYWRFRMDDFLKFEDEDSNLYLAEF